MQAQFPCPYTSSNCPLFNPVFTTEEIQQSASSSSILPPGPPQPLAPHRQSSQDYINYSLSPSTSTSSHQQQQPQNYLSLLAGATQDIPQSTLSPSSAGGGCGGSAGYSPSNGNGNINSNAATARTISHGTCGANAQLQSHKRPQGDPASPYAVVNQQPAPDMEDFFSDSNKRLSTSPRESLSAGSPEGSVSTGLGAAGDHHGEVVTPFISKLSHLLAHPSQYGTDITWSADGTQLIFKHVSPSLLELFSRFFRHKQVSSFVRQLNIYSFTRLSTISLLTALDATFPASSLPPGTSLPSPSDYSAFSHPLFFRSCTELGTCDLTKLVPKKTRVTKPRPKRNRSKKAKNEEHEEPVLEHYGDEDAEHEQEGLGVDDDGPGWEQARGHAHGGLKRGSLEMEEQQSKRFREG